MAKISISSLELAAVVNELQFLVGGKLTQIYHQEKKELLFQLHAQGEGKKLLKIIPGKYLCLTKIKDDAPLKPSSFCMQLRKYLSNATINSITQYEADRVVVIELEKSQKYIMIIELYAKGNLVMTDLDNNIIAALERQTWRDRVVKVGEKYVFPSHGVNWKDITDEKLLGLLKSSEKNNLATSLAIELGFGGVYSEEICKLASVDKSKLPGDVTETEVKIIVKTIGEMLEKLKKPQGYLYDDQITPFSLSEMTEKERFDSYSAALDTIDPFKTTSPYNNKIKTIMTMIKAQEGSIKKQEDSITINTKKGETVYAQYQPLHKMLDFVKQSRNDGKEWKEIEEELKKIKKIKKVDLKSKKIIIDL
ncbi:hypothetical protein COY27_05520 [Candidatus Woesearchaeota archaeon CG_4_10_14_0_2_um_filter_33_13]|nr:MAG: hypothetical protein COY27_05520 [Candidatus Woesearchaeota archaeon CG_4_10_14_0_2_um_filter_33_13]